MWFPRAGNNIASNAARGSQAAAIAALVMQEETKGPAELEQSSSAGTGKTAVVSNTVDGGSASKDGGEQLAEDKNSKIAVTKLAKDISKLEVQIVAVEREIDEVGL